MDQQYKLMIKLTLDKADQALASAKLNFENNFLTETQNRSYYAVFYVVLALGYLDNFVTGKHHKLMGWFNKKYVYENKIFDKSFSKTYSRLIANREKFDYNVDEFPDKEQTIKDMEDAKFFVSKVKNYILHKIQENE